MNELDHDACYRAVAGRDQRFDGYFVTAVRTTGIYCRPSCPAITPKRRNVEFYATAAAAHERGFRACKRCRPDASPGSPEWDRRGDVVARTMRLIADGVVDRDGVGGLARRLSYSERQLHRLVVGALGAGPLAIARAQRAQTARTLIELTSMPFTQVAYAAGFGSIRQFNDTIREVFAASPSELRAARRPGAVAPADGGATTVGVDLAVRDPFDLDAVLGFFAARAVPGVEVVDADGTYRRSLRLPRGHGVVAIAPTVVTLPGRVAVHVDVRLDDWRDLAPAVRRVRRMLDLDADPTAIDETLSADPAMAPLVAASPGLRAPGSVDPFESAIRAVIGQQVSVAGAGTVAGRLAAAAGAQLSDSLVGHGPTVVFPSPAAIAAVDPDVLAMPRRRRATVIELATRVAAGDLPLDVGADRAAVRAGLLAVAGIGPWTADYTLLRGFGDPDIFLADDLGVVHALDRLGIDPTAAEHWAPWRSYATHHLWNSPISPPAPEGTPR